MIEYIAIFISDDISQLRKSYTYEKQLPEFTQNLHNIIIPATLDQRESWDMLVHYFLPLSYNRATFCRILLVISQQRAGQQFKKSQISYKQATRSLFVLMSLPRTQQQKFIFSIFMWNTYTLHHIMKGHFLWNSSN